MTTQTSRFSERKGIHAGLHGGRPDHDAAVYRSGDRLRPRLCRQGTAQQGRGRRGARRGADAEQRRSPCRGGNIFQPNFPVGYHGHHVGHRPSSPGFFNLQTDAVNGLNIVTITATAILPTTFMRLGTYDEVTVTSTGEATRRMVDLSLVLDVSELDRVRVGRGPRRFAHFVNAFTAAHDRCALITYSNTRGSSIRCRRAAVSPRPR